MFLFRSTNASLILACGFPELVPLCKVISWKTPHSCKDTKMATPLEFCRGMSRPVNWYCLIHVISCDKTCGEHASRLYELPLCAGSFFDFFPFSRRRLRYFVLSALGIGEYKRLDGNIYRNLRKLSLLFCYVNEHDLESPWLWDQVNPLVQLSRQIAQSLSSQLLFGIGGKDP